MINNERFEALADELGFEVTNIYNRPDIRSVKFHKRHIMTIPTKMFDVKKPQYKDLNGTTHPNYAECESRLKQAYVECNKVRKYWDVEEFDRQNCVHNYA